MKIIFAVIGALALTASPALAGPPAIYSDDGKFLGTLGGKYEADSVNNPYGTYGSKYAPDGVNNPYSRYGSKYSPDYVDLPDEGDEVGGDGDRDE